MRLKVNKQNLKIYSERKINKMWNTFLGEIIITVGFFGGLGLVILLGASCGELKRFEDKTK